MTKKRGQLSLDEEKFIRDNVKKLSIDDIASQLNRNAAPVKRYIVENRLLEDNDILNDEEYLKHKLHSKTFWNEIKKQFDNESGELEYFESVWINLIRQFREDVLPAEE
jgi:IS30 family transposase